MVVNLSKGGRVDLTKGTNITKVKVALGWDTNKYDGSADFDLDVVAFLAQGNGKVKGEADFVFYNNLVHVSGAVEHTGDNLTGSGDGDDEVIYVDFTKVPDHVEKIAFAVTIHEADSRRQNFGMVSNSFVRVDDVTNNAQGIPLVNFDLGEDFSIETSVVVCELYKHGNDWKFNAIGAGYSNGLVGLVRDYGLQA